MWTANARAEKPSPSPSGTLAGAHRGSVGDSAARAAGAPSNSRGTSLIRNRFPPYDPLRTTGIGLRYGPTGWWFRMSEAPMYCQSTLDRTRSAGIAVRAALVHPGTLPGSHGRCQSLPVDYHARPFVGVFKSHFLRDLVDSWRQMPTKWLK